MTLIEKPVAGQPMRAGWGVSVAERLNQIGSVGAPGQLVREGLFGQGVAPLPKNQRDRRGTPAAPQPYEVRWDPGLSNGDGGWKIYLPGEHLLRVDGEYIDELGGVTAIEDDNGDETGWFEFDEIDASATAIWLVVAKEESGNEGEATVSAQFATEEDAEGANNVCIAEVSFTAASQSTPAVVEIKQSVVGALVINRGDDNPAPFDVEDGEIVNCKFFWDGQEQTLADYSAPVGTASVYLRCVGTASQSASAVRGYTWAFSLGTSPASTGGNIYRNYKIYDFTNGKVALDWRHTFLALFSDTAKEIEPDGVSINKVPEASPGTTPDGDEGKTQIKDWKAGTNAATQGRNFSLAEVLTFGPEANLSRGDKMIVRGDPTYNGGAADLAYRAVGQLPFDGMSVEGTYVNQEPKIQIKDFDTAAATEVTLSSTATADKFLVKSVGGNVEYRTLKAPAGGGSADISALNGVTLVTNVEWIGSPTYAIRVTKRTCTVANNVLTLGNAQTTDIQTTPLSQEANAS